MANCLGTILLITLNEFINYLTQLKRENARFQNIGTTRQYGIDRRKGNRSYRAAE